MGESCEEHHHLGVSEKSTWEEVTGSEENGRNQKKSFKNQEWSALSHHI